MTANGWQPIETAPEGDNLLVCVQYDVGNDELVTDMWVDFWIDPEGDGRQYWCRFPNLIHVPFPPTKWMSLPEPPK